MLEILTTAPADYGSVDMLDYDRYISAFNHGDNAAFAAAWLTEDCVFHFGARVATGREAIVAFLNEAHDGIREVIRPQTVIRESGRLFCEADIDFYALRDLPVHFSGPLREGTFSTVKYFLLYRVRDDRVATLDAARWPTGEGVTKP